MLPLAARLYDAYHRLILTRPRSTLAVLLTLLAFFSYHAKDFGLDASADSLMLEDDKDLQLYRQLDTRYPSLSLLIVTYTPSGDLFSDDSLSHLARLRDELRSLDQVDSVLSILDAPLVTSSDVPLQEMADKVQTLESPTADRERAIEELTESPIYQDLIISRDRQTAAVLVNLKSNPQQSLMGRVLTGGGRDYETLILPFRR